MIIFGKTIHETKLGISDKDRGIYKQLLEDLDYTYSGNQTKGISHISHEKELLEYPTLLHLKNKIIKEFYTFKNQVMRYENRFEIVRSWIAKSEPGQSSDFHNHNNCMWSGVYYIDVPQKSGGITFENFDMQRFQLNVTDYNQNNSDKWTVIPQTDTIIFFPSEVYHKIETNESNMTRYSIAFNLLPVGEIGDNKSDSYINNLQNVPK
tara:strand:+ start:474 stop:1097 length:624 start_codon:yes stop_codon:yes gene_type:complete